MKKLISILLVLTIIVSLNVFAESNVSKTVTDELAAYGIMQGDPDGNLRLNDKITRAEMTKIIVTALGYKENAPVNTVFTDVNSNHWASGYINTAYENGIVTGNGDATFSPGNYVTNEQAVKMLVCALGYEQRALTKGGYPFGYMIEANSIGVLENLNLIGAEDAIRGDIAVMVHNAINTPLMVEEKTDDGINYIIMDGENGVELQTLVTKNFSK